MGCRDCTSCQDGPCQGLLPEAELPTALPLVVYDGECTFCRRWLKRYESLSPRDRLAWSSYQNAAGLFPGIPETAFTRWLHLIRADGTHARGTEAIFEIMHRIDLRSWPLWLYRSLPPFRWVCDAGYRVVADHRGMAGLLARLSWGRYEIPATTHLTRRVFLRLLGVIFLLAFLSIQWQADGLFGAQGLRPWNQWLDQVRLATGGESAFFDLPTAFWLGGEGLFRAVFVVGIVASVAVILGLIPMLSMAVAWGCYLSIVNVGSVFLSYQWDVFLLEVGFVAIFWSPATWRLNAVGARRPSVLLRWMLLWLLMRFMFTSGWAKLASQDPTWWDLTALDFHYWTQPLPWWMAWYAWQLPMWCQKLGCLAMFIIELGIPLLIILPRMPRLFAFMSLVALQVVIAMTGNYGFFNWLTIVLCVVLLDDSQLLYLWPRRARGLIRVGLAQAASTPRRLLTTLVALGLLSLSIPITVTQLTKEPMLSGWKQTLAPWHLVNQYGLFKIMTTTRPEVLIEASMDGHTWSPYVFRYKPGPLDRAPALCQPDMPRLDWQLWFDGLFYERVFEMGLLRNSMTTLPDDGRRVLPDLLVAFASSNPQVLGLIETAAVEPGQRPAFLRWHLDRYRFTTSAEGQATGDWWTRERLFSSGVLDGALLSH